MTKYKIVKSYWEAFSSAVEENECELQIALIEIIEQSLPFKDEAEHIKWLNVLDVFKFWQDLESLTLTIIKRLKAHK